MLMKMVRWFFPDPADYSNPFPTRPTFKDAILPLAQMVQDLNYVSDQLATKIADNMEIIEELQGENADAMAERAQTQAFVGALRKLTDTTEELPDASN